MEIPSPLADGIAPAEILKTEKNIPENRRAVGSLKELLHT